MSAPIMNHVLPGAKLLGQSIASVELALWSRPSSSVAFRLVRPRSLGLRRGSLRDAPAFGAIAFTGALLRAVIRLGCRQGCQPKHDDSQYSTFVRKIHCIPL